MAPDAVLEIHDLAVEFPAADGGWRRVLRGVSLAVGASERVALVGESGSGKSVVALAALGLVAAPGRITDGRVQVGGLDLATATSDQLRRVRGRSVGLVFQEPAGAFNPVYTIGFQIAETVRSHRAVGRAEAQAIARSLLATAALDEPSGIGHAYPHQLSGGQLQRAMIALALAGDPGLLIADEPTTALDLETQARILALLRRLADGGRALLLISHDLAVVAGLVDRVVVLFAGEVVEAAPTEALFSAPLHPYTRWLLAAAGRASAGDPPAAIDSDAAPVAGCRFAPRCVLAQPDCRLRPPPLTTIAPQRALRCPIVAAAAGSAATPRGRDGNG